MVIWIAGNTRAGKTTLARKLLSHAPHAVHLDGDDMRKSISRDLGFTEDDRRTNNLRIARLAALLDAQGFLVVVSTICPYRSLRDHVRQICHCEFILLEGGMEPTTLHPFER